MSDFWRAAAAGPHVRRFHDGERMWSVWEVTRELLLDMGIADGALAAELHEGWLCFQRGGERRRFQPLPSGWHHLSDPQLAGICRRAELVVRHGEGRMLRQPSDTQAADERPDARAG